MRTKPMSVSGNVNVGKVTGGGFLNVTPTSIKSRPGAPGLTDLTPGDFKIPSGGHFLEVVLKRKAVYGDADFDPEATADEQKTVYEVSRFGVSEGAAYALGVFLKNSVEEEDELVKPITDLDKNSPDYEAKKEAALAAMSEEDRADAEAILAERDAIPPPDPDNPYPNAFDVDAARAAEEAPPGEVAPTGDVAESTPVESF